MSPTRVPSRPGSAAAAAVLAAVLLPSAALAAGPSADLDYPPTRKVDQVDVYHGVEVADPYRWLEEDVRTSDDVADWVRAQNRLTFGYLESIPERQRPDLFGAALPAVGVMDMLRFHKFTAGRSWVGDYGSADEPEDFAALRAYSPYHSLDPADYPATLVTTADTDDRVVPAHSFKFAARLQEVHRGEAPVLIRIEERAGHGAGKATSQKIEEATDELAFLVHVLGLGDERPTNEATKGAGR